MPKKDYSPTLIQTKLHQSPLPADLVHRTRLTNLLDKSILPPLILISAPAGYGKSTLAKVLVETVDCRSGWISLDEHDDDLVVFLSYFLHAIYKIFPEFEAETEVLLKSSPLPPLRDLTNSLINELNQIEEDYLLILDDYHYIHNPSIHELLDQLLLHPPLSLHLLISTRQDPLLSLTRLRAHARIAEFRAADLRFTIDETAEFMEKTMGAEVDLATVEFLDKRTEGWVTGLRLAALAMRHSLGVERIPQNLSINNRFITEYLVKEILSQQAEIYSTAILKISILKRFNAELCQLLCFEAESNQGIGLDSGQAFLDWLEASNLFLVPLDDQRHWFRFHHLFRDFLLEELEHRMTPEWVSELHTLASYWHEENLHFEEALQHALAAHNMGHAVRLVTRRRYALMNEAEWQQVNRILDAFPPTIIEQSPDLLMLKAWLKYHDGQWQELPGVVSEIERLLEQSEFPSEVARFLQGELSALHSLLSYLAVDPQNSILHAEKSIASTHPEIWIVRVLARVCLAAARQMKGDLIGAYRTIYEGLETESFKSDHAKATLVQSACNIHWIAGDLPGMVSAAKQCIQLSQNARNPEILGFGLLHLGTASYQVNDLETAKESFAEVVQRPYQNYGDSLAYSAFGLSLTYQALGNPDQARQVADKALNIFLETGNTSMLYVAQAFQAELALRQGEFPTAFQWADQFVAPPSLIPIFRMYSPHLTLIKIWLAQNSSASRERASNYLGELDAFFASVHNTQVRIEVLALQALLAEANGDRNSAYRLLTRALKLAESTGNIRLFIDHGNKMINLLRDLYDQRISRAYTSRLLKAASPAGQTPTRIDPSEFVEPLTNREIDVLSLLAERKTNKEIAHQLGIAPGTVRQHTHNLYGKLEVSNRREAVARALALGVLKK